ncbi:hypothetical protein FBU30_010922 [Linnemannia zychae]|nr:hypothetical protein FBU30_010922 [Linnemannia zychae]
MRYFRYYHSVAIVALVAIAASSTWTNTLVADARPLDLATTIEKRQAVHVPEAALAAPAPAPSKSSTPEPDNPAPTSDPKPPPPPEVTSRDPPPVTTDRPDPPQPTKNPQPTQQPLPPAPKPNPNPNPNPAPPPPHQPSPHSSSSNSHSTSAGRNGASETVSPDNTQPTPPASTGVPDDDSEVPTKVSKKVLIGLGAVGGLFLFALGGVAFCRHRRKKNLAAALLKQTAQFNHNNPYAKINEAAAKNGNTNSNDMAAKENLPMTPTKPIGTFSVVADYTPAMPDEIEIYYGDSVTVLLEYDDGWCMGINNSRGGIKGVVPRHCLSGGNSQANNYGDGGQYGGDGNDGYYPPNPSFKTMANKRMSSIPVGGWSNGSGGYQGAGHDGYAEYPPSSHYNQGAAHLGPSNQGYYGGY